MGYHLSHENLFTKDYPYLNITSPVILNIIPGLDEKVWRQLKSNDKTNTFQHIEIEEDNELNLSLFD